MAGHYQLNKTQTSCPYDVLPNTRVTQKRIKVMEDNTNDEPQRVFDEFPQGNLKKHGDRAWLCFRFQYDEYV